MQTEISSSMKKIKELSEAVQKSGGLEDLRDKIAATNVKLEELQSREDATDSLSALQSEVVAIKKEVEKLSRKMGNDGKLMELQVALNQLKKMNPKSSNEVLGTCTTTFFPLTKATNSNIKCLDQTPIATNAWNIYIFELS